MKSKTKSPQNTQAVSAKKQQGQTRGDSQRDPKGRKGQYGGAGDSPIIKK